jgi:acyl-CoA thioester hydrolase
MDNSDSGRGAWWSMRFEVRDYELDIQGIVNNANYLHYFEHARHAFIRSRGLDFAAMHDTGLDAVVFRAEVDWREPLRSGDSFEVQVRARRESRLKLVFEERIVKAAGRESADGRESAAGRFIVALMQGGRPVPVPEDIARALLVDAASNVVASGPSDQS